MTTRILRNFQTEADMKTIPDTERSRDNPFSKLDWPTPRTLRRAHQARSQALGQLIVTCWTNAVRFFKRQSRPGGESSRSSQATTR